MTDKSVKNKLCSTIICGKIWVLFGPLAHSTYVLKVIWLNPLAAGGLDVGRDKHQRLTKLTVMD